MFPPLHRLRPRHLAVGGRMDCSVTASLVGGSLASRVSRAVVLGVLGCMLLRPVAQGAQAQVHLTHTVDAPNPVASGQDFTYTITYSCSSTTGSARNVVLTDTLPAEIEFQGLVPTGDIASSSLPAVGTAGGTLVLTFIDPLPDGSSGSLSITARYRAGSTPNGTVRTNSASVTGTDVPTEVESVVTTSSASSTWAVSKTGPATATLGTNGVSYSVGLCSAGTSVGQLDLTAATLVDTLPVGVVPADVLDADGATVGGTGTPGDPVVLTWALGALSSVTGVACPAAASRTVAVRYPASQYTDGEVVRDVATATGVPVGATSVSLGSAPVDTTLSLPAVTRTLTQAASTASPYLGSSFGWRLNPANASAVSLEAFTLTDVHLRC